MQREIDVVTCGVKEIPTELKEKIAALQVRTGASVADVACRPNKQCPRGLLLIHLDPSQPKGTRLARAIINHHDADWEQVNTLMANLTQLIGIEQVKVSR